MLEYLSHKSFLSSIYKGALDSNVFVRVGDVDENTFELKYLVIVKGNVLLSVISDIWV